MKSEDYQGILNQYTIVDQDDKPYVTLKGVELVLKMHETEVKKLHKPIVSSSLPADAEMWEREYNGACREIMSLQEQLKEAENEIRDLIAELRNVN